MTQICICRICGRGWKYFGSSHFCPYCGTFAIQEVEEEFPLLLMDKIKGFEAEFPGDVKFSPATAVEFKQDKTLPTLVQHQEFVISLIQSVKEEGR